MSGPERNASPIAASIEVFRRQLGLGAATSFRTISDSWSSLVGTELASSTEFVELRGGVVVVHAHDSASADALSWRRRGLIDEIAALCPRERITELNVRVRRPRRP